MAGRYVQTAVQSEAGGLGRVPARTIKFAAFSVRGISGQEASEGRRVTSSTVCTYLAGTNTRRVRRALAALFGGTVGKDTVSRTWRKVKSDWDTWNTRSLAEDPIVRLILDGTVVRVRLDRKATSFTLANAA